MIIIQKKRRKATISTYFGGLKTDKEILSPQQKRAEAPNSVRFNRKFQRNANKINK